ncbi:hypothetical protein NE237_010277 [Protea cynaroides]|uniref:Uncharacterized protein n=1 Tax=Protea cynaroides TaxID=273540 RepID=A0A9Q0R1F9_9MAGN|nr:hypothetical protein NE237_010277 [Protea cynaroides]
MFANSLWCTQFDQATVYVHPLLLTLFRHLHWAKRPFRYEAMWSLHTDYRRVVQNCWKEDESHEWQGGEFLRKIDQTQAQFKLWNKNVFGHLQTKIAEVKSSTPGHSAATTQ